MFLADAGITVWLIAIFLVGLFGFIVMVVALAFRLLGWVFRAVSGVSRSTRSPSGSGAARHVTCSESGCGQANPPTALYCARCGRPLRRAYDVDAYG